MKRKILSFLVMITTLLSVVVNVEALTTASDSYANDVINIASLHTQATHGNHYSIRDYANNLLVSYSKGFSNGNGAGVIRYKDSEGNSIFCAELGAEYGGGKTSTSERVLSGSGAVCGIINSMNGTDKTYIVGEVEDGQNIEATNKKWTVDNKITPSDFNNYTTNNESYVKIQRAIWKYQNYTGTCATSYEEKTADDPINFSLQNLNNKEVKLSSDGKYYETTLTYSNIAQKLELFTERISFTVSAPAEVEYISDSQTKIKIPVSSFVNGMKINVRATGKYTADNYTTYTPKLTIYEMSEHQDMGTVALEKKVGKIITIDTNKEITLTLPTGSIELVKSDANNAAKIQGAKFQLYVKKGTEYVAATDYNGKVIPELITDVNGKIVVSNLPYGSYKLEETAAAVGYVYDKENHYSQSFTLDATNKTFTDEVTNESIKIIISKKDVANEKEVEGAKIVVYEYDTTKKEIGEVVKEFVSSKTTTQFYIEPGVYALKETVAPESYKKVETTFIFEVTQDRNVKLLDTYSEKDIKTSKNIITLYNEVEPVIIPDVPNTGSSIKILFIVLGSLLLVAGSGLIYFTIKRKNAQSI